MNEWNYIKLRADDVAVIAPPGNVVFLGSAEDAARITEMLEPFWDRCLREWAGQDARKLDGKKP